MARNYEIRGSRLIEIRYPGGRERQVSPEHHSYIDWLVGNPGGPLIVEHDPPPPSPKLDRDAARVQAVSELMGEYNQALARWDAFSETTKTEALASWKAKVEARAIKLEG